MNVELVPLQHNGFRLIGLTINGVFDHVVAQLMKVGVII